MQESEIPGPFDRRDNLGLRHLALEVAEVSALGELDVELSKRPDVENGYEPEALGGGPSQHMMPAIPGGIRLALIAPLPS